MSLEGLSLNIVRLGVGSFQSTSLHLLFHLEFDATHSLPSHSLSSLSLSCLSPELSFCVLNLLRASLKAKTKTSF